MINSKVISFNLTTVVNRPYTAAQLLLACLENRGANDDETAKKLQAFGFPVPLTRLKAIMKTDQFMAILVSLADKDDRAKITKLAKELIPAPQIVQPQPQREENTRTSPIPTMANLLAKYLSPSDLELIASDAGLYTPGIAQSGNEELYALNIIKAAIKEERLEALLANAIERAPVIESELNSTDRSSNDVNRRRPISLSPQLQRETVAIISGMFSVEDLRLEAAGVGINIASINVYSGSGETITSNIVKGAIKECKLIELIAALRERYSQNQELYNLERKILAQQST